MYNIFRLCDHAVTIDLTGADTSGVIGAKYAFQGTNDLANIVGFSDLDFSSCKTFEECFRLQSPQTPFAFNADMSNWNLGESAETFQRMYKNRTFEAGYFISGIENLNPANLIDNCFLEFINTASSLTTESYDALLIKMAGYIGNYTITGKSMHMGGSQYTAGGAAEAAWNALDADGWSIIDGGSI